MRTFRYNPARYWELRKSALKRSLPIMLVAVAVGLYIGIGGTPSQSRSVNLLPIIIPVAAFVSLISVSLGLAIGVRRQKALYESYRLTIDEEGITREQLNTPTIRILKNDITLIAKNRNKSFTIKGKNSREVIGIAAQIENYDELETLLRQIKPFSDSFVDSPLQRHGRLSGLVTLVLFAAVFLSQDRMTVTVCSIPLLGLMGWSFIESLRSRNLDRRTRRSMLIMIIPILVILARLVFLWM